MFFFIKEQKRLYELIIFPYVLIIIGFIIKEKYILNQIDNFTISCGMKKNTVNPR